MIKLKNIIVESVLDDPNFKNWFNNSRVIDSKGNPLIMYHANREKKTKLEPSMRNAAEASLVWFCSRPLKEYGNYIYKAYLRIENPIPEKEYLAISNWGGRTVAGIMKEQGYDGTLDESAGGFIAGVLNSSQIYLIDN